FPRSNTPADPRNATAPRLVGAPARFLSRLASRRAPSESCHAPPPAAGAISPAPAPAAPPAPAQPAAGASRDGAPAIAHPPPPAAVVPLHTAGSSPAADTGHLLPHTGPATSPPAP